MVPGGNHEATSDALDTRHGRRPRGPCVGLASPGAGRSQSRRPPRRAFAGPWSSAACPATTSTGSSTPGRSRRSPKGWSIGAGSSRRNVRVRFGVEPKDGDGPALKGSRGLSTRENLAADAEALRKESTPEDAVWVIVLGHGHFDGRRSHFNIPGPDLTDSAFARLFDGIKAREQVFFVTTSASGFFLKPLAKPGRVAISATEADQEVNETLFPLALADMLAAPRPRPTAIRTGRSPSSSSTSPSSPT